MSQDFALIALVSLPTALLFCFMALGLLGDRYKSLVEREKTLSPESKEFASIQRGKRWIDRIEVCVFISQFGCVFAFLFLLFNGGR